MTTSIGRPTAAETRRRTREMVRLIAAGQPVSRAAAEARVKPERALQIVDELVRVRMLEVRGEAA